MSFSSSNVKLSIVWKVQLLLYARPSIHSLFNLHAYARKNNYATVVESVFVWKWTLVYRLHLLGENGNRPKTHLFKNALQNGDFENPLVLYSCGYQLLDTSKWARSHQRRNRLNHFQLLLRFHGARFLRWGTLFDKCARNTYRLHVDTIVFMTFIASCKRCSCYPLRCALWLQSFRLYNTGD